MPSDRLKMGAGLRVLVTGGRAYPDRDVVWTALDKIHAKHGVLCVITGHCTTRNPATGRYELSGADKHAEDWAHARGVPCTDEKYAVTWGEWKTIGKRAGPLRTDRMIEQESPDLCVHAPGGSGTDYCVRKCRERGILCYNPITNEAT